MIKIKHKNTQVEIGDFEIKENESLSISIDKREIVLTNLTMGEEEDQEEEIKAEVNPRKGETGQKYPELETEAKPGQEENNKGGRGQGRTKQYTEEKLFEDLLKKCSVMGHFPRTRDIQNDDNMASQHTYHDRLGSLSNVVDRLGHKLKNEDITEKMREVVANFCKQNNVEPSGENMWKMLVENQKKYRKNHPRGVNILKKLN